MNVIRIAIACLSLSTMVANSQALQARSPVNIAQQRLLDGQHAVWDYLIGEDSWTEEELTIPLDTEVTHSGDWVIGTSQATTSPLAFNITVFIDFELNDPFDESIPQETRDFIAEHGYRGGAVYGHAFGPDGGATPIAFAGYTFTSVNNEGVDESRLLVAGPLTEDELSGIEDAYNDYENSVALYGDLPDPDLGLPPTVAVAYYCPGVTADPDAIFDSCILQANQNYQCRWRKLRRRGRNAVVGGGILLAACVFVPPACLPGAAVLGGAIYCLRNAADDSVFDYQNAIACCCNALQCRANGGGDACVDVLGCNPTGCSIPLCGK